MWRVQFERLLGGEVSPVVLTWNVIIVHLLFLLEDTLAPMAAKAIGGGVSLCSPPLPFLVYVGF